MNRRTSVTDFRKMLIETMCNCGLLINDKLGEGYTDWHSDIGECGLSFTLNTGEEFSLIITKDN